MNPRGSDSVRVRSTADIGIVASRYAMPRAFASDSFSPTRASAGIGEHAVRHEPIARRLGAAVQRVAQDPKVVERDMRELRAASAVADGPHTGSRRFKTVVDDNVAPRVQFDACRLESKAIRVGRPARSD